MHLIIGYVAPHVIILNIFAIRQNILYLFLYLYNFAKLLYYAWTYLIFIECILHQKNLNISFFYEPQAVVFLGTSLRPTDATTIK